jgi:hypothetical protein
MLHAVWHWPEMEDTSLWPMAMAHAVYLYNNTPNQLTGIAPIETFTGTLSDGQAPRNLHPWGCPAYVLEPRLQDGDGGKIQRLGLESSASWARRTGYFGYASEIPALHPWPWIPKLLGSCSSTENYYI